MNTLEQHNHKYAHSEERNEYNLEEVFLGIIEGDKFNDNRK